ncbi:MAG: tetratricopeptide repeat protein, partial [Phormidesmis sp.]
GATLGNLGVVYNSQGRWAEVIAQYQQSLEIKRELGDRHGEGYTLNNLGMVYRAQGRWEEAIAQYHQSLETFRDLGDRYGEGQALGNLGNVYKSQGRWKEAISQYHQSLETFRELGDHHGEGMTLMNLGYLYLARSQYNKAIDYWQAAQAKLHPDSPEAKRNAQKLKNPYPIQQMLTGGLIILAILAFATVNLVRGHWVISLLTLLAFASFLTYRLWKLRRGNSKR